MTTPAVSRRDAAPVALLAGGLLVAALAAHYAGNASAGVTGAALSFVSLVAESLPFLLVGALLSSLLTTPAGRRLLGAASRRPRLAAAVAPLAGAVLPLCDCGLLPLARRLRDNGSQRAVGPFLAGAPLTNPIVVISTLLAFPGQPGMAVGRVLGGLAMAGAVAALVTPPALVPVPEEHEHDHAGGRVATELLQTTPTLVLGALAAALLKAALPTSVFTSLASQPLLGAAAMIGLAIVMSLCSQADAFVASALPVGPLPRLAFLVVGPALDLRLAALYRREFGGRWVLRYAAVVVPTALIVATVCTTAGLQ